MANCSGSASRAVDSYHWDYEVGTSSKQNVRIEFPTPGKYTITLTVRDGSASATDEITKVVGD